MILPWEFSQFSKEAGRGVSMNVKRYLKENGFWFDSAPDDPDLILMIERISSMLLDESKSHWVTIMSADSDLLDELARYLLVTICLSDFVFPPTPVMSYLRNLKSLLTAPRPKDDIVSDPAGNQLYSIEEAGVLCLHGITLREWGMINHEGSIHKLLTERLSRCLPTVFVAPLDCMAKNAKELAKIIGQCLGNVNGNLIAKKSNLVQVVLPSGTWPSVSTMSFGNKSK